MVTFRLRQIVLNFRLARCVAAAAKRFRLATTSPCELPHEVILITNAAKTALGAVCKTLALADGELCRRLATSLWNNSPSLWGDAATNARRRSTAIGARA